MENEENIKTITIPLKLLEQIYMDYLMFTTHSITDNYKEYNYSDNYSEEDNLIQTIEKIKFYLEK